MACLPLPPPCNSTSCSCQRVPVSLGMQNKWLSLELWAFQALQFSLASFHHAVSPRVSYRKDEAIIIFQTLNVYADYRQFMACQAEPGLAVLPCKPRALTFAILVITATEGSTLYRDSQQGQINHIPWCLDLHADCLCTARLNKRCSILVVLSYYNYDDFLSCISISLSHTIKEFLGTEVGSVRTVIIWLLQMVYSQLLDKVRHV